MVIFDKVSLSSNNVITVKAHIDESLIFEGYTIRRISCAKADAFTTSGIPREKELFWDDFLDRSVKTDLYYTINETNFDPTIKVDINKDLLLICIEVGLVYSNSYIENLPCYLDKRYHYALVFNNNILKEKALCYAKRVADDCSDRKDFINFILNYEAYKAYADSGDIINATKIWNKLFLNSNVIKCNCNGSN